MGKGQPFSEEEWIAERAEDCNRIIGDIFDAMDQLRQLPASEQEALQIIAVDGIDALLPAVTALAPPGMSRDQCLAAMMLGKGLTVAEAGKSLDLVNSEASIHHWMTNRAFRRLVQHWRDVTMSDQLGLVFRDLDMLTTKDLRADVALKVTRLRYEISQAPANRELAEASLHLKARQVQALENQGPPPARPAWLDERRPSGRVIDADFEASPEDPLDSEDDHVSL
jgi:hypothetical protein